MTLYRCLKQASEVFSHDAEYKMRLVSNPEQCLTVKSDDRVGMEACANTGRQQWLRVRRTSAYFNPGTGRRLDLQINAVVDAPIRVFKCTGNEFRQWTLLCQMSGGDHV
ncbi:RICIN domain-containing protein [Pandoraea anapnoica]|uniref:RICIN domain-containing protein n=1 Tax=Pandoraea anapnoica TaxID=2508301 RepID=UPI001241F900